MGGGRSTLQDDDPAGSNVGADLAGLPSCIIFEENCMRRSVGWFEFPRIFVLYLVTFWFNNTLLLLGACVRNRIGYFTSWTQVYNP